MNTWFKENVMSSSMCKLVISILLGALLVTISMVFLATSSYAALPTILAVDPSEALNNFDTSIVITGTDFQVTVSDTIVLTAPVVRLGDTVLPLEGLVTSCTLTAIVPWGLDEGVYPISVENTDGTTATLTSAFTVTAALDVWTTGGPDGGSVSHGLEMDPDVTSTLYANLDFMGLYKSDDKGESWRNMFAGFVTRFTLKPDDPQTIYLSGDTDTGSKFLRSANGGEDWEIIWDGRPWDLGVSPGNPDYLYFVSGLTITRSVDGGNTWEAASNGLPDAPWAFNDPWVSVLAVHPITPDIAYTGIYSGEIYKTTDGGGNWMATSANFGETWWNDLVIDPHNPERIYASGWHGAEFFARSLDGGTSWQTMTLGTDVPFANDIKFHPTVSGTMYALTFWGIYSSTNAGATWKVIPDSPGGWTHLLHPQTGLPFYIGHNGKAFLRSDNGGVDWQVRNHGLAGVQPHEITASLADPRYIYMVAGDAGGFVSNNGGQSWRFAVESTEGINKDAVAANPCTPTVAYMGGHYEIYKTTDGGQTWVSYELPGLAAQDEARISTIVIDPNDPHVIYAGAGTWDFTGGAEYGWLYQSLDAGVAWNMLTVTFPISPVTDIVIDPTDSQTIYAATGRRWVDTTDRGSGIIKTSDGGDSWEFINDGLTALNISRLTINPDNPQILYAGSNLATFEQEGGIFKTTNGGEHWEQAMEWLRISGLEIDPVITDTVYAGSYWAGLFSSTDAGSTWERVDGPLGHLSSLSLNVTKAQSRTIVYAGVSGGVVSLTAADAANMVRAAANDDQLFGSGVYQLTVDHRHRPTLVYLPLVMKD